MELGWVALVAGDLQLDGALDCPNVELSTGASRGQNLQSGLMIIAAVLQIAGVIIWMHVLPALFLQTDLTNSLLVVVDTLALSLLSAGCFMGGATTAWITVNLFQEKVLPQFWLIFPLLAGLCATVAALFIFNRYLLGSALLCWLIGGFWLSTRRRLPSPFSELP